MMGGQMRERRYTGQNVIYERRKQKDWVVKAVSVFSVLAWVGAICALLFLETARPDGEDLFSRFWISPVVSYWNTNLLHWVLGILIAVVLACVTGFFFNMSRHRRKTDKYSKSIMIAGSLSIVFLVLFLIGFARLL